MTARSPQERRGVAGLLVGAVLATVMAATTLVPATVASAVVLAPGTAAALQSLAVNEKVAHDLYAVLGDRYDAVLFDTIAASETRHGETVGALLVKHGIVDPTAGDPAGSFDDPVVQASYDALVAEGSGSAADALATGVTIEDRLISLLSGMLATSQPRDVATVATNLLDASRNHRAAFATAVADAAAGPPAAVPVRLVQSAEVRAQVSGRYHVGDTLVLAARPVVTDAGVTIRWRVTAESRNVCEVRTRDGRSVVRLERPGTCRVEGVAPAPSAEYLPYRVQRVYRVLR